MGLKRIEHFVHVAELGNMSRAAERLNIVQPALSQSIRRLEDELNVILFTRSKKGMELTEAGRLFLESARGILNQYNRARENISSIGDDPKGRVSVAMTASALHALTVPLCGYLSERYPHIELNLEEGLAADIQRGFEAGDYDLVVNYLATPSEGIHIEPLIEEELFLTGAYSKSLPTKDISFKDLKNFKLIMPQEQHGVLKTVDEIAEKAGIELGLSQFTAALHPTIELISAGHGHSLLPWAAIYDRINRRRLSVRRVVRPKVTHKISMIHPTYRPLTQATLAVMDIIRQTMIAVHKEGVWPGKLLMKMN